MVYLSGHSVLYEPWFANSAGVAGLERGAPLSDAKRVLQPRDLLCLHKAPLAALPGEFPLPLCAEKAPLSRACLDRWSATPVRKKGSRVLQQALSQSPVPKPILPPAEQGWGWPIRQRQQTRGLPPAVAPQGPAGPMRFYACWGPFWLPPPFPPCLLDFLLQRIQGPSAPQKPCQQGQACQPPPGRSERRPGYAASESSWWEM